MAKPGRASWIVFCLLIFTLSSTAAGHQPQTPSPAKPPASDAAKQTLDIATLKARITSLRDFACSPDPAAEAAAPANKALLVTYENMLLNALSDKITALDSRKDLDADERSILATARTKERDDLKSFLDKKSACDYAPSGKGATTAIAASRIPDLAPPFTITPGLLGFDNKEVGDSQQKTFTITAATSDATPPIMLDIPAVDGCDDRHRCAYRIDPGETPCSQTLGQTPCNYKVTFAPVHAGIGENRKTLHVSWSDSAGHKGTSAMNLYGTAYVADVASLDGNGAGGGTPSVRSVVGFDLSAASATDSQAKAFLEFNLNVPLGYGASRKDPLNWPLWGFLNPRLTSVATAGNLAGLFTKSPTDFSNIQEKNLVQGLDVTGGLEYMLLKPRNGIKSFSSYKNMHARMAVALVGGGGFTTPFSAPGGPPVFVLGANNPLRTKFNVPPSFTNIAFVTPDRSRFFRKYFAGVRLKTYHFTGRASGHFCDEDNSDCEALMNSFPGVIDVTAAQDEQVTGGHLSHWVLRLDGIYPLPFAPGFHIFGSLSSAFQKNVTSNELFVAPPPATVAANDPSVFLAPAPQPASHDIYRIGLGVDIFQLLNARKAQAGPHLTDEGTSPATPELKRRQAGQSTASGAPGATGSPDKSGAADKPADKKPGTTP